MKKKIVLLELVFEITRKCNLRCDGFCMRGNSQKMTLSKETIDKIFNNTAYDITYIHNLVLSGGEPTLEPNIISYLINTIINKNIDVNQIRLVSNGQIFSQQIIDSFQKLDNYMKLKNNNNQRYALILFSVDEYHHSIPHKVSELYKENGIIIKENIIFSDSSQMNIIKTGLNESIGKDFKYTCDPMRYFIKDSIIYTIDEFYICSNGNITTNGMGSYKDMDKINFGNVETTNIFEIIKKNGRRLGEGKWTI